MGGIVLKVTDFFYTQPDTINVGLCPDAQPQVLITQNYQI